MILWRLRLDYSILDRGDSNRFRPGEAHHDENPMVIYSGGLDTRGDSRILVGAPSGGRLHFEVPEVRRQFAQDVVPKSIVRQRT